MLLEKNLSFVSKTRQKYTFLSAVGSVLRKLPYVRKTIWGTGSFEDPIYCKETKKYSSLDVRCLRGPLTEQKLINEGVLKTKINVYGDPAVLAPFIFSCKEQKQYDVSVIPHMNEKIDTSLHVINSRTKDWKFVVREIVKSRLIISSSLHGIILAEAYGVPAIWLNNENSAQGKFKYLDYYYSTNRFNPNCAGSIDEALKMPFPEVPNLGKLQKDLLNSFPYDLWEK